MNRECIEKIVCASGVKPGEKVLVHFWGEDSEKEIANFFVTAAASAGATPLLLQQSRSINREIFSRAADTSFGEDYFEMLSGFDAVLDVFAYRPIILGYELAPDKMELYRRYIRRLFGALMKAKRFTQIRIPTAENAAESGLDPDDYVCRMEKAYDIDYAALEKVCREKADALANKESIILHTGDCCAVRFDISGRKWHIDAGDGDMPCGEIYIAPKENSASGKIFFGRLLIEDVGKFENVTLFTENGRVISADNDEVKAYIQSLSEENRVVCELGFGMNPNIGSMCGYNLLDEKMAGTFHIALGANHMFGGENHADMHLDLVSSGKFRIETK